MAEDLEGVLGEDGHGNGEPHRAKRIVEPIATPSLKVFSTMKQKIEARTRGITMYWTGSTAMRRSASSCPDICIEPISTVKAVPILLAKIAPAMRIVVSESSM